MGQWKSILFMYNPQAGRGQIRDNLHTVIDILNRGGAMVTVYPTRKRLDACQKILSLGKNGPLPFDLVVVSGGDGTLHEVVNGMMRLPQERRIPIGYIPTGSTNDFASSHGIPRTIAEAAENILTGDAVPFDVGQFGSAYFSYVAAFGSFVDVSYDTPQDVKNAFGYVAYIMEGARRLNQYRPIRIKAEIVNDDGSQEVFEDRVVLGVVCNTYSVGGFSIRTEMIDLHDGCSELSLIRANEKVIDYMPIVTAVLQKQYDKADGIFYRKVRSVRFLSQEKVPWTLDGEYGGKVSDISLSTCQDALKFIVSSEG